MDYLHREVITPLDDAEEIETYVVALTQRVEQGCGKNDWRGALLCTRGGGERKEAIIKAMRQMNSLQRDINI